MHSDTSCDFTMKWAPSLPMCVCNVRTGISKIYKMTHTLTQFTIYLQFSMYSTLCLTLYFCQRIQISLCFLLHFVPPKRCSKPCLTFVEHSSGIKSSHGSMNYFLWHGRCSSVQLTVSLLTGWFPVGLCVCVCVCVCVFWSVSEWLSLLHTSPGISSSWSYSKNVL